MLWASGAALILLDTQAALGQLLEQPKLLAKVTVVVVLTANGVALHTIAFPTLLGQRRRGRYAAAVAAALGSLSAASWLAATLLGIARGPAARFQYLDFMAAYAALLGAALAFGLLCVRPRIVHKLRSGVRPFERRGSPGADVPRIQ